MKLMEYSDGMKVFFCPGCQQLHGLDVRWNFNGDFKQPTFRPSLHYVGRCHSFITDGRIQFLPDCSHDLAGNTVDLPDVEEELQK
ncbi:DUF6527 family protein [Brevibacillus centrosporus]|uniref:DUF6527 family protein n=1 Tax=Brevibacillus centrosporus TaxID=54910 RepID=UPI003B021593